MAFKLTTSKVTAIRAFIAEWVKDRRMYCNYCGSDYRPAPIGCVEEPCCEKPQIGNNAQFLGLLIRENKSLRDSRNNEFASNKDKTMRWGISMTPMLYRDLGDYCDNTLRDPLFSDKEEMDEFMRSFPEFRICSKV